jgi:hypothetical protein
MSNDAEHLIEIRDGKRYYQGKYLAPAVMLWKCTTPGCETPPKPQRRGQYKDKFICNACANRIKSQNPEILKKRGEAISRSIQELGDKWSEVATKNMSSQATREKISISIKKSIENNKEEAIRIRRETALKNNKKSGFGTAQFSKKVWENLLPEERQERTHAAAVAMTETVQKEHVKLMEERYIGFQLVDFGHPDNVYRCPQGHVFLMRSSNFLKRGNCPECIEKSKIEIELHNWILTILPNAKRNKRVLFLDDTKNGNRALEIDSFDPEIKFGVELHGIYHHQEEFVGNIHKKKAELADKWGYTLLQFFEDEINFKNDIVKSIIKSKLNIDIQTIYARDCEVVLLEYKEIVKFLEYNHLQGKCRSFLKIGLKYNNELVSVLTFRKPRNKSSGAVEIARYCTKMGLKITGGFSRMLKKSEEILKKMNYNKIITYSDRRYSKGEVYKTNGFVFKYFTVPDMFWVKGSNRYPREISWGKTEEEMKRYKKILGAGNSYWEKDIL